ncbi:hypothetical protein DYB25_002152 [Aphanomyces astaci]|uniref:Ion transport domain-containing protein n=1 Tax=Aphanomyces astaci TaxID=112090 RepID=A0A397F268_APHAT|nr:hypothetical protein DYB36_009886 [Aphanomyces astaci]RHY17322.1 hypothetical protein DYB25_002152 [Aphanomyces astaci]RHY72804.1 hypothetical protein DYB34_012051 [Aphanomyces astaci]RHZ11990.1 hypothetical protein DYB31_007938 [Aphanomyces astaci]
MYTIVDAAGTCVRPLYGGAVVDRAPGTVYGCVFCPRYEDMLLSFRTGYIESGEIVMDPKEVSHHYMWSWFVVDIVSNFPFRFVLTSTANPKSVKFLKLQKIPKLLRFTRLLKYMRQYAKYYKFVLTLCVMAVSLHSFSYVRTDVSEQ